MLFNREPALIMAVIHAAIALAIGFGLQISVEQFALVEAFLAAVLGLIVRQNVFSPTTVKQDYVSKLSEDAPGDH